MGIEIERKFRVQGQAWRAASERVQPMLQGYLDGTAATAHGPGKASVRVRIEGEQAFLNLKSRQSGPLRQEFEYPIPLADARALLPLCSGGLVEKNRHYLHHQGHLWEVDEFLGDNAGLVVAEIELGAVDEAFARPGWLGAEVTDQPRYYNLALASHPYTQWPATQRHDPDWQRLALPSSLPHPAGMRIDIWSDVVCPWCWIGKHRFERGVQLLGADAPALEVHWHPFQLDPDAGTDPMPLRQAYAARFGGAERTAQMLSRTQATARDEGLPMDFDRGQVKVTTLPAHRLMWLAAREGDAAAVNEALFRAHFAEGRNLADPQTLVEAGATGGLAAERIRALLDSDEGLAEVHAQLAQARSMGITAVPTFVIDGRYAVQGGQAPEMFAQALRQAMADAAPAAAAPGEAACGPDGCAV